MHYIKKFGWLCSNILHWVFSFIGELFRGILSIFGIHPQPPNERHEDIQPEDITQAYEEAAAARSVTEDLQPSLDARLDAVYAYARAAAEDRGAIDLSALAEDEQTWLMAVSDGDLKRMAAAGRLGCITALVHKSVAQMTVKAHTKKAVIAPEPIAPAVPKVDLLRDAYRSRRVGGHPHPSFKPAGLH